MAGDTNEWNIAARIYFEKTNHDRITLNPPKTNKIDCIIKNSQVIPKWGQTVSQLSPDSPCKAPTRKANFVEVLERWGSVPMRQLAFYIYRKGVVGCLFLYWMFPFKRKGANSYSQRMPQTGTPFRTFDIAICIENPIPFSFLILIPTNCTEQHRKLQHPFLAGASSSKQLRKE